MWILVDSIFAKVFSKLPMEDPFLKFSPFAGSDNLLVRHSLEIIGSFLVYQVVLSRWLVPRVNALVFGRHYTSSKIRTRGSTSTSILCQCSSAW